MAPKHYGFQSWNLLFQGAIFRVPAVTLSEGPKRLQRGGGFNYCIFSNFHLPDLWNWSNLTHVSSDLLVQPPTRKPGGCLGQFWGSLLLSFMGIITNFSTRIPIKHPGLQTALGGGGTKAQGTVGPPKDGIFPTQHEWNSETIVETQPLEWYWNDGSEIPRPTTLGMYLKSCKWWDVQFHIHRKGKQWKCLACAQCSVATSKRRHWGFFARYPTPMCYTESKRTNCHGSEHQEISGHIHEKFQQKIIQTVTKPTPKLVAKKIPQVPLACDSRVWDPGSAFLFFLNPCKTPWWPELEDWVAAWQALGIPGDRQGEAWSASANLYARRKNIHLQHLPELGGGNSNIFYFPPLFGKMNPIWHAYVSHGLVQPRN